jgi:hypothetical protein
MGLPQFLVILIFVLSGAYHVFLHGQVRVEIVKTEKWLISAGILMLLLYLGGFWR